MRLYDDYVELRPGAISRLEQLLTKYSSCTGGEDDLSDSGMTSKTSSPSNAVSWTSEILSKIWPFNKRSSNLPRHHSSKRGAEDLGTCPTISERPRPNHDFLLLCVPYMRLASKLWQADICRINSDREFFRVLRYYYDRRGKRPWARLRKVRAVHFVKVCSLISITICRLLSLAGLQTHLRVLSYVARRIVYRID